MKIFTHLHAINFTCFGRMDVDFFLPLWGWDQLLPPPCRPRATQISIMANADALAHYVTRSSTATILTVRQGCPLTHCRIVMSYGDIGVGQHWLRYWLVSCWHQTITWTGRSYLQPLSRWLLIIEVMWHSLESKFAASVKVTIPYSTIDGN